ncbi:MAG: substrate-binding domain-containing protein [Ferruginibacter sp.]|nr:substrate-binding domain-containing protein [Cytophagales bacterium]
MWVVTVFSACQRNDNRESYTDTPTSGEINLSADESLYPLVEAEIGTFQGIYTYAKIKARYLPENEAIQALLTDSARVAVLSRKLNPTELQYFEELKLKITTVPFAIDAIALIVNTNNPDTLLTYDQLLNIVRGKIKNWGEVNPKSALSGMNVVFDNSNSSTVRFIKDSLAKTARLPSNCFAVNSNPKVIEYVSTHSDAIGLIGVGWISDQDDPISRGFLKQVKVMSLSNPGTDSSATAFYQPFQAEIKQKLYPLSREIYIVSRENRSGLGSGFAAFVASDRGQRIVQKSGLLPTTLPMRIIQLGDGSRLEQDQN